MELREKPATASAHSLDDFVANLSKDERQAFARLLSERDKNHASWEQMRERYQRSANAAPLFSLSHELHLDVGRIQQLESLEDRYGNLSTYFSD